MIMKDQSEKTENQKVDKKSSKKRAEDIIATAKKRFAMAEAAEVDIRRDAYNDLTFRSGEQWPDDVRAERASDQRPCLTINRIPQFVRQVTNDQRQNRPAIKIHPVDDDADVETAKIYQGLIKHIESNSNADTAYDTAFEGAAVKGFGYFYITTDWVDSHSFDQEILVKRIRNSFTVYIDPASKEIDGSDMNWGFIFENILKDDFKAEYPESELCSLDGWSSIGDDQQDWIDDETIRVAQYWYREYKSVKIVLLSNGVTIEKSDLDELYPDGLPEELKIVTERESKVPYIKCCTINGVEILEEIDWPGKYIPIVPVFGDELDIDGKRILEGIVRHAKDPQRMLNYWKSTETETIALAPRAPFIVAEGQIPKEYEYIWKTANRKNHAYLPYKPTSISGQPVAPPQRNSFEPAVGAITNATMQAADDLKSTTGIYDASLGGRSNETSGIAIQRRNMQSQTSNFHLIDNLNRSIKHAGRIIVDLIPHIYDAPRTAVIIGETGEKEVIRINQEFQKNGKTTKYSLGVGKYDVTVEAGPSYATKRLEAASSMEQLTRAYPQIMQVAGDLMVKNMDWPGASEIAERLKKTLPPNLLDDAESGEINPQQIKGQMDQMNQTIQQLTQALEQANAVIDQKKMELESDERIAFARMETDLRKEVIKNSGIGAVDALNGQIEEIRMRLNLLDIKQPINSNFDNQYSQNPMTNLDMNGSGFQQAGMQNEFNNQSTGGISPGQPMGEF